MLRNKIYFPLFPVVSSFSEQSGGVSKVRIAKALRTLKQFSFVFTKYHTRSWMLADVGMADWETGRVIPAEAEIQFLINVLRGQLAL